MRLQWRCWKVWQVFSFWSLGRQEHHPSREDLLSVLITRQHMHFAGRRYDRHWKMLTAAIGGRIAIHASHAYVSIRRQRSETRLINADIRPFTFSRDYCLRFFLHSPDCHVVSGDRQAFLCTHDLLSARSFYRRQSDRSNETSALGCLDCVKCRGLAYQGSYRHLILSLDSTSATVSITNSDNHFSFFSRHKCSCSYVTRVRFTCASGKP